LSIPAARTVVTHHSASIAGREVRYVATAGTLLLDNAKHETTASVFYVAYVAEDLGPPAQRPLTFAYNGGPGGSSALINLGGFGPRMVVTSDGEQTPPPPYAIVDNPDSLLDKTDLVFIDAVGTGFSRLAGSGTAKDYYGVDQDGRAFAQFIRRYLTANDRWNSPKYLAGESYGTTRSAVLAKILEDDGISLSGITLMSTVLDFATIQGGDDDDLLYELYLPTEAAVASRYHKSAGASPLDRRALLGEVCAFALGPYAQALAEGSELTPAASERIATKLHDYIGLPVAYLERSRLRVPPDRFEKALLGDSGETVGRYDARFRDFDLDPIAAEAERDPSADAVFGAFTASVNRYLRDELGYTTDEKYEFLSGDVNESWDWKRGEHESPNALDVGSDLAQAMTANPYLKVLSVNGIFDLATPFYATEYELHHLGIAPQLQANVSFRYYPSGHMIYLNPAAHDALKRDLDAFYAATSRS
jgi:carboxypeptidase C (cathepsin A)